MLKDRLISLVFIAFGSMLFYSSYSYPDEAVAFPKFIFVVFIGLSLLLFAAPNRRKYVNLKELFSFEKLLTLVLVILYIIGIPIIGYFSSSIIFAVAYMYLFEKKGLLKHLAISAGLMVLFYFAFQKFLNVWLPKGWLF